MVEPAKRVLGYCRVSTSEQSQSGAGLAAQRSAIKREIKSRRWTLLDLHQDIASGKSLAGRDGLDAALALLDAGEADVLLVSKLDRLSRSLLDFALLMERSRRRGWSLVALDLGVDTTTPAGEMLASLMATFAQYERRIIGQRTRDALAVKKAQGVRLGRPSGLPLHVLKRVREERWAGATLQAIADGLNRDSVPTAQGGARWHASTVRVALAQAEASAAAVA